MSHFLIRKSVVLVFGPAPVCLQDFEDASNRLRRKLGVAFDGACPDIQGCQGLGRVSSEHWVQSHPDLQPCDLDEQRTAGTLGAKIVEMLRSEEVSMVGKQVFLPNNG